MLSSREQPPPGNLSFLSTAWITIDGDARLSLCVIIEW